MTYFQVVYHDNGTWRPVDDGFYLIRASANDRKDKLIASGHRVAIKTLEETGIEFFDPK
jgi:hypothetical protein